MEAPKKPTSSKIVYQNPWITIHEDTTTTQDGQTGIYGYLESRDSVMVAPIDSNNRICLIKAFRYPSKSWGWELPGGGGDGENLVEASKRELEEETGIVAANVRQLAVTYVCNGLMTEKQATCVAWDLRFDGHKEETDEVFMDQKFFSLTEISNMIAGGKINDNQTITGIYLVKEWIESNYERVRI